MQPSRALAIALEPLVGQVYFSPECHANYAALGFAPSPSQANGVALPDGAAYFTSRGSLMGQVPGTVVAAAFAVFNPAVVIPSVDTGWTLTDARTICQARDDGAIAQLERILGPEPEGVERVEELLRQTVAPLRPEGRPLYAGVAAQPMPATALGRVWRLGDMLREFRGDCHTAAWVGAGLDAVEIGLLSELYWGLPMRSYARTRAWSDEQFDIAFDRLRTRNLVDDRGFLDAGRDLREAIEVSTDRQMVRAMVGLDTHLDELLDIVLPWGTAIRAAKGYPASGPHDLAEHASKG
ncbi:MAG: hypothetical protein RI900_67 [Actinomycetota bacterium]